MCETKSQFWNQLLNLALSIEAKEMNSAAIADLMVQLESLEIQYERSFDPADQYPEYATFLLCKNLKKLFSNDSAWQ